MSSSSSSAASSSSSSTPVRPTDSSSSSTTTCSAGTTGSSADSTTSARALWTPTLFLTPAPVGSILLSFLAGLLVATVWGWRRKKSSSSSSSSSSRPRRREDTTTTRKKAPPVVDPQANRGDEPQEEEEEEDYDDDHPNDDEEEEEDADEDEMTIPTTRGRRPDWGWSQAPYKMVLVVNHSTELSMGKGKIAAQCGHATLGCYQQALQACPGALQVWQRTGAAKIALKGTDTQELLQLQQRARELSIPHYLVEDAGRTQIAAGSKTVLGLFGPVAAFQGLTDHLKLL